MKRSALGMLLLAAACGGSTPKPAPVTTPPTPTEDVSFDALSPKQDPAFAFRAGYTNPGGMWLPQQMSLPQHVENFANMGVSMPATRLSNPLEAPLAAVVSIGGCTASLVSPEGLVVTNHHCVQGSLLYRVGQGDGDLVENGFLAKTRADEKTIGPGGRVMVAQAYTDVTKQMTDGLADIADPTKRKDEVETRQKTLVADCEKDRPGIKCNLSSLFRGGEYQLIEYLEIRDVRLVYVPHRSIGNYGGEVDNWQWPRHTGDWSFYRAYVAPDGSAADYSPDNVPFKPKHYLQVSSAGLKPSDFVMITGYPGNTERTNTYSEIKHDVDWYYPYLIEYYQQRYDLAATFLDETVAVPATDKEPATTKKSDTAIKAGVSQQSIQNGLEKFKGTLAGLKTGDLMTRKQALEAQITAWASQAGHESTKAGIEQLEALLAADRATARNDFERARVFSGSSLLSSAIGFARLAEERTKPNAQRKPGYQERDMAARAAGVASMGSRYAQPLDRAVFRLTLTRALALPAADRPWLATVLGVKAKTTIDEKLIDATLDKLYKGTKLENEALRMELLTKATPTSLKKSKDPFVQMALRILPIIKADEKKSDAEAGQYLLAAPQYAYAMRQVLNGFLSPDANSTLRITYGTVKSFTPNSPAEADWPFTTAAQLLKKDTGKDPFDAPAAELAAIKAKNYGPYADASLGGELAIDFLSDLDITGGNSGSPTINGRGELVGLAFDGTKAGLASDVVWNGATTRTISVDARYMLWVMDAIDGADHLITEMGLTPAIQ